MITWNNTSKFLPIKDPATATFGVILPHSSRVLLPLEINTRIELLNSRINHLSKSFLPRKTHGGKRYRINKINQQSKVNALKNELRTLESARNRVEMLIKKSLVNNLTRNNIEIVETPPLNPVITTQIDKKSLGFDFDPIIISNLCEKYKIEITVERLDRRMIPNEWVRVYIKPPGTKRMKICKITNPCHKDNRRLCLSLRSFKEFEPLFKFIEDAMRSYGYGGGDFAGKKLKLINPNFKYFPPGCSIV